MNSTFPSSHFSPVHAIDATYHGASSSKASEPVDISLGVRTGEWFAVGDASEHPAPPSIAPGPLSEAPQPPRARRVLVRVVGCLAIAGTLACLVRVATHAPARQAILQWGSFGQGARLHAIGGGAAQKQAFR
ncbi:MAG TPA: hypothetical protein VJT73_15930 [Polyangiaceae bacterium]|nr:hypothetical protein [Polyangiaceae bacterium]